MDNSTWTPEELRLINLQATVEYEFIARSSTRFDDHLKLLHEYEGRNDSAYKEASIAGSIAHHNRFNIGAVKIILDGKLSRSLMVENYRGWMLLSRLISHNHPRLPLLSAFGNKFITELADAYRCQGIFATLNRKNRMYLTCMDTDRFTMFNADNPLFNRHRASLVGVKRLEGTRMFMYTEQNVMYRGNGDIEEVFK
jgi:hypothetical protein